MNRREFLASASGAASARLPLARGKETKQASPPKFRLGLVTYMVGAQWDLLTLLSTCRAAGFHAVELRTSHAHKIEPSLSAAERSEAKKKIEDSGVVLWGLGSVCEFHSPDPAVVRKNIDQCAAFCRLAADLGARGVKVRPNGLAKGVEVARTLDQIGRSLAECGKTAADCGVEIFLEVHGSGTAEPERIRTIMDASSHPSVGVCWNSNPTDVQDGSIARSFGLLKKDLRSCHINELASGYPYRELFTAMRATGYDRVTLMETAGVPEAPGATSPAAALRFMRYYRALWTELCRPAEK